MDIKMTHLGPQGRAKVALKQELGRAQPVVLVRQRLAACKVNRVHHRVTIKPAHGATLSEFHCNAIGMLQAVSGGPQGH